MKFQKILRLLIFSILIILFSSNIFAYKVLFSGYETYAFIKNKITESEKVILCSLTFDKDLLEEIFQREYYIFLEKSLNKIKLPNVFYDNSVGYLHEKFIIFDDNSVIFGTGNFTYSGMISDRNIFIYTKDKKMINCFFREMNNFKNNKFGKNKKVVIRKFYCSDFGKVIFVTSPSKKIYEEVLKYYRKSNDCINIFSFSFTDPYFVFEIENNASRGVDIKILSDDWNKIYNSPLKFLKGVDICYRDDIHVKCSVIDNKYVVIGSYNYTYRARNVNDEFVFIIQNYKLADYINRYFFLLYEEVKN